MTISAETRAALFAQETGDGLLVLLTIDHADLATPIRVVNNQEQVSSRGDDFVGFPFQIVLPTAEAGRPPRARLTIDNVSREVIQAIRTISSAASVLVEVVRLKDPDSLELALPQLLLRNVRADATQVQGDVVSEDLELEPYPADAFTPGYFPGLF